MATYDKTQYETLLTRLLSDRTAKVGQIASLASYGPSQNIRERIFEHFKDMNVEYVPGGIFSSNLIRLRIPKRLVDLDDEEESIKVVFSGNSVRASNVYRDEAGEYIMADADIDIGDDFESVLLEVEVAAPFSSLRIEYEGNRERGDASVLARAASGAWEYARDIAPSWTEAVKGRNSELGHLDSTWVWAFRINRIRGDGFCIAILDDNSVGSCS